MHDVVKNPRNIQRNYYWCWKFIHKVYLHVKQCRAYLAGESNDLISIHDKDRWKNRLLQVLFFALPLNQTKQKVVSFITIVYSRLNFGGILHRVKKMLPLPDSHRALRDFSSLSRSSLLLWGRCCYPHCQRKERGADTPYQLLPEERKGEEIKELLAAEKEMLFVLPFSWKSQI